MKRDVPEELNWVKARAACSVEKVFASLHDGVEEDLKEANSLRPDGLDRFRIIRAEDGRSFTVRRGESINKFVSVVLENGCIAIVKARGQEAKFTVGLNNEGRCQLRSEKEGFEQWQVRKMALEDLLF